MPKTTSLAVDLVLRGSLITLRRRCGKPGCHCADGVPHETPALSCSIRGTTQIITLRKEDLPTVRAALCRYQQARKELDREALAGLRALRRYARQRSRRQ